MARGDIETRSGSLTIPSGKIATGYAARFNRETVIGSYFREQIAPGAFATSLRRNDVVALLDHDTGRVLGRKSAGTLRLAEDSVGLLFEVDLDARTPDGQTAYATVDRQDIRGCSFGFSVRSENWDIGDDDDLPLRTLLEIELHEISIVAFPAYDSTSVVLADRGKLRSAKPTAVSAKRYPSTTLGNQAAARLRIHERKARMEQMFRGILHEPWK